MIKVLLADDDFTMVALLKTLLGMVGFETSSLLDQKGDLIDNIRRENPDILLLDLHLETISGLEIVRQVRATEDLKHVRIIMVSGIDKSEECKAAGADDFLLKPYMPDELFAMLRAGSPE